MSFRFSLLFFFLYIGICGVNNIYSRIREEIEFIKPYEQNGRIMFSLRDLGGNIGNAYITGNFVNWKYDAIKMRRELFGNRFFAALELNEGRYEYKFVIDGEWIEDLSNPLSCNDGYGGANSVIYVTSNNTLDWDQKDRFVNWKHIERFAFEPFSAYPDGLFYVSNLVLEFTNLTVELSEGYARVVIGEPGVTGLIFYGSVKTGLSHNMAQNGSYAYLRFHPSFFEEIKESLENLGWVGTRKRDKQDAMIKCNNAYFLLHKRFYAAEDRFVMPPEDFVGVTVLDEDLRNEATFITHDRRYIPILEFMRSTMSQIPARVNNVDNRTFREMTFVLENMSEGLRENDPEIIHSILYPFKDSRFIEHFIRMRVYENFVFNPESLKIQRITLSDEEILRYFEAESPVVASMEYSTRYTRSVLSVIAVKYKGEWRIITSRF
jgi:hypothetical protein